MWKTLHTSSGSSKVKNTSLSFFFVLLKRLGLNHTFKDKPDLGQLCPEPVCIQELKLRWAGKCSLCVPSCMDLSLPVTCISLQGCGNTFSWCGCLKVTKIYCHSVGAWNPKSKCQVIFPQKAPKQPLSPLLDYYISQNSLACRSSFPIPVSVFTCLSPCCCLFLKGTLIIRFRVHPKSKTISRFLTWWHLQGPLLPNRIIFAYCYCTHFCKKPHSILHSAHFRNRLAA